jgi:hypothetical protein
MCADAEGFLTFVLPRLDQMRRDEARLGDLGAKAEHPEAAQRLMQSLCEVAHSFPLIGRDVLMNSDTLVPNAKEVRTDLRWLENVGYLLEEQLGKFRLQWPPKVKEPPPSIVRDLRAMYEDIAYRNIRLAPLDGAKLQAVIDNVANKACNLSGRKQWAKATKDLNKVGRGPSKLTTALGFMGLAIAAPGDINEFANEAAELGGNIVSMSTAAGNYAIDIGTELQEFLEELLRLDRGEQETDETS